MFLVLRRLAVDVTFRASTRLVLRVSAVPWEGLTEGMYGLLRLMQMKTLRIVNEKGCVYVERNLFCRWWVRTSPKYRTNIEAWNWVRRQGKVNLVKK
jgi:hypothetical protein